MKVFILTEVGKRIGFGHITRCVSIYQALEEAGIQSQLIVNGDEGAGGLLQGKNHKALNWIDDQESLFATIRNADIVFIDSYLADHDVYQKISETAKTACYFDDNMRIEYPRGYVLNGAILAEKMSYPKKEGLTYLLGAQYAPLRKELWDTPAKLIRKNIETLMITFGGSDMRNVTVKVQKVINKTFPYLKKKIIVTSFFSAISEIKRLQDENTELIYEPDAPEFKEVMQETDIAISAGGQTLYELARIGVPTITVCTADNQLNNIRGWEKADFVEYAGGWEDENLTEVITQKVELLKDKTVREKKRTIGNKYIDGKGSTRIVEELSSSIVNI